MAVQRSSTGLEELASVSSFQLLTTAMNTDVGVQCTHHPHLVGDMDGAKVLLCCRCKSAYVFHMGPKLMETELHDHHWHRDLSSTSSPFKFSCCTCKRSLAFSVLVGIEFQQVTAQLQRQGKTQQKLLEDALTTALAYVNNALSDARKRAAVIPLTNARLKSTLLALDGGLELLTLAGFVNTGEALRLNDDDDTLSKLKFAKLFLGFELETWKGHMDREAGICMLFS